MVQEFDVMNYGGQSRPKFLGRRVRWSHSAALLFMLAGVVGCGDGRPARYPVSGRVTIDGAPVTLGSIKLVPEKGRPSFGEIGPDGRFTLTCYDGKDGALLGKHRVQINANRGISEKKTEIFTPKKYCDFRTSGIEVVIDKPVDDLKIELTWGNEKKGPYIETMYSGS